MRYWKDVYFTGEVGVVAEAWFLSSFFYIKR